MTKDETKDILRTIGLKRAKEGEVAECQAIDMAINAIEEVQAYRAIGTVEDLESMKENGCFSGVELAQLAAMQMRLRDYQTIGTVEECRDAVENREKAIKKCLSVLYRNAGKFISTKFYHEVYTEIAEQLKGGAEECADGWILVSSGRLPNEPKITDDIEDSIYNNRVTEYNVMIIGAEIPTTLYYIGNGEWYDEASQECYPVFAWQPLPAFYQQSISS